MFFITLELAGNKHRASELMADHNAWLQQGFDDGAFLLAGNLDSAAGGFVLAQADGLEAITERVNADPFVAQSVVSPSITAFTPKRGDERLKFLLEA